MKTALAFVCSLMLAWTNIVLAQAPVASAASAAACCKCSKKCCATKHSESESQPVSAAPSSSVQNQISLIAPATIAWALPNSPAREFSSSISPSSSEAGAPLFARNCAWLI